MTRMTRCKEISVDYPRANKDIVTYENPADRASGGLW